MITPNNASLLVLNAGSSTLKYALFAASDLSPLQQGTLEHTGSALSFQTALQRLFPILDEYPLLAVGHRVVHGGTHFTAPVRLEVATLAQLETLVPLAPLHQPHNLAGIAAMQQLRPDVAQIACFDTAFHRSQSALAQRYGLPRRFHDAGVRHYGFHGLSYESIAAQLPQHLGDIASGRIVVAHLGNGASLCGMLDGKSVATSMGFSTLDGLLMGTRCGSIDPGVLLYLLQHEGMSVDELTTLLYKESGLLGVSGISSDMRALLASDSPAAVEAVALFCYRIQREIGSLAAALGGVDALVFTAGIGEHSAAVRDGVCAGLGWLGLPAARILTLPCREELTIAAHVQRLLAI